MDNKNKLDQEEIRQRLNDFRKEEELTIRKLSVMLKISKAHLGQFLRGKHTASNKLLEQMDMLMKTYKVTYRLHEEDLWQSDKDKLKDSM